MWKWQPRSNDLQMSFKVIKSGTNGKLVCDFLLVLCSNFVVSRIVYEKFDVKQSNDLEISPWSIDSRITWMWFLISNLNFCGCTLYNFWYIVRWNCNIGWNDIQMSFEVIERCTNRKIELLLVIYSNFRHITHRFRDTSYFNAEIHIFACPICIWPWVWRPCCWNMETKFGVRKLAPCGCHMVKKS